jgi:hypothetical protein
MVDPEAIRALFAACAALGLTPDGLMVGELGERIAATRYGLDRTAASTKEHDAIAPDGRRVEVKATAGTRGIAMRGCSEHLIVLQFDAAGEADEVFNGPGEKAWAAASKRNPRNGQHTISLRKLRELQADVPPADRLQEMP